jgi:chromatin structure-remodeling complex subunit RSC9
LEQASARRNAERAAAQEGLQQSNGEPRLMIDVEVGDKQPALSQATKNKLYAMPEPKRSITW